MQGNEQQYGLQSQCDLVGNDNSRIHELREREEKEREVCSRDECNLNSCRRICSGPPYLCPSRMTPTTDLPPLYSIPKPLRPPHGSLVTAISFCVLFNLGIILTNLFQILTYPLSLTPLTFGIYLRLSAFTKGSFGALTIGLSQWFAPTKFVVTAGEGMPVDGSWIRRGIKGEIQGIVLPDRGIWVSTAELSLRWFQVACKWGRG